MGLFDKQTDSAGSARPAHAATSPDKTHEPTPASLVKSVASSSRAWADKSVLFVSSANTCAVEVEKLFGVVRDRWTITNVQGFVAALALSENKKFDAVIVDVSDNREALSFAKELRQRRPAWLQFFRCTAPDWEFFTATTELPSVQFILREANMEAAATVVDRAFRLGLWRAHPAVNKILARLRTLPSLPSLYVQVTRELQTPNGSLEFVARLIARDPVMTAKVLQMVNSIHFALPRQISDPMEAVLLLGAERTRSMILLAKVVSQFDQARCTGLSVDQLWLHSMATGAMAQSLCVLEKKGSLADTAFTAGLLHDIGKLLLASNVPEEYNAIAIQSARRKLPLREVEREILETTHAEVGAALLGTWGLPLPILEAIAWHHSPGESPDKAFSILTAVHAANVLDHEKKGQGETNNFTSIDADYLETLGLRDRRNPWRQRFGLRIKPEDQPLVEAIGIKSKAA